ncbi:MAG: hypothetical protein AAF442_03665 [Pseudomonadota bacterium]
MKKPNPINPISNKIHGKKERVIHKVKAAKLNSKSLSQTSGQGMVLLRNRKPTISKNTGNKTSETAKLRGVPNISII